MMTEQELADALNKISEMEDLDGRTMFIDRPDAWYEANLWRCLNGHVTSNVLLGGAEFEGKWRYDLCVQCAVPVRLTFPADKTGPLPKPPEFMF